ncbi:terminase small subunit [Methylobacterium sp. WL6]|uniref:terminase small subunit n=1 Tax=Methylobacterium sp. WL6 TaxID=2603901 RepID=UPI0011CB032B|nr:terminase small subunit [Methylobacterium sp. WL6]TXN60427.1 hypothetical protein FV230_26130 [Methylobacterium sp. WL6]
MSDARGRILNRCETAEIFGRSLPTIDNWVRLGCPFVERGERGREWQFNSAEVLDWRERRAVAKALGGALSGDLDPAQERARKDRALAIATELKNDLATGKVVLIDDAIAAVTIQNMKLRNKLLSMPTRIASRLPEQGRAQVFTLVEAEVRSAMEELTTGGEGHVTPAEVAAERGLTAPVEEPAHGR